ncbi:MAG: hypothetical protein ACK4MV_20480 [Beijerinckiaceae bacterium]
MIRMTLAIAALGAFVASSGPGAAVAADMPASYKSAKAKKASAKKTASNKQNKVSYDSYRGWMTSSDRKYFGK